jgi:hypothetical protein
VKIKKATKPAPKKKGLSPGLLAYMAAKKAAKAQKPAPAAKTKNARTTRKTRTTKKARKKTRLGNFTKTLDSRRSVKSKPQITTTTSRNLW